MRGFSNGDEDESSILRDSFNDSTDFVVVQLNQLYINMTNNKLFILTN